MSSVFKLVARLPLWLLHALGWCLGWCVFAASTAYRQRFLANARQAGMRWRQYLGGVGAAGQLALELPRLWHGRPVAVQWDGRQHVQAALAQGNGIIFLTPHLGCFEVTAQAYAQSFGRSGAPMTVLYREPRQSWLRHLVATARARPGLRTAPATLAGVKQMLRALKNGESLGLLPDQVPPLGLGMWLTFFGRPAYTMTLAARLAQQTGSTVLLAWGQRLPWGRGYRVHVRPLGLALPADVALASLAINQAMEGLVRLCPQQYLWGYARYKQPRREL